MIVSKFATQGCLYAQKLSLLKAFRPSSVRKYVHIWKSQTAHTSYFLKVGRLSGLCLSAWYIPFLRLAECKSRIPLSRRADHLSRQYLSNEEPSLALSDVWSLIRPYWFWFLAAVVSAVLAAVVNIQLPIYLGELIDKIVQLIKDQSRGAVGDLAIIKPQAIKLVLCYTAQAVLTFFYISFLTVLGERMAADLRVKLFDRLLVMDMAFFDSQKTAELTSRLNVDVQEFKSCFKLTVAQGLRTLAQVGGCVVSLFRISPQMTMYTVAALPLVIAIGTLFGALLRSLSRRAQAQSAVAAAVADEALGNIQTVRAFAMEEQESRLFEREIRSACSLQETLGMGIGLFQGATNFFLNGIVLSVLYGGSKMINAGEMTPGELMSFLVTAQTIQRSLSQLSIVFGNAVKGWTAGARVFQFANLRPSIRIDDGVCIPYHTLWGEVRFEDVGFAYPTRPEHHVFEKLNLTIPAGQIVALCGPSGEGKSTIAALLERFYEPLSGRILLDNQDLRTLNLEWLRGQVIGLISQEPVLFATSIEENIRYGRPNATQEEVMQAAQLANAHEFISKFPDGYKTIVGERGTQLSGGQKQRIAIARALLKNPPILVLDEATSALDAESERSVRDALDQAMKGRTVLIIAHRLSTIRNANLICVVKDKKVLEQGTHDQLVQKQGIYYNLIKSQFTEN
ncbi:putative antigen peptide transporter-like 2 [Ancylostoma caninum]|uniref:Mitochondrial potassium channel ATP-binding subunit n=1 Tax=Ancylostoma caninum TaxID=29170 RepID=A0A368GMN7_ANCCA|nr:putative antigen peptide transporter-like 2 [Ancylostoma caninum]